jgi:hypothetical protein
VRQALAVYGSHRNVNRLRDRRRKVFPESGQGLKVKETNEKHKQ